MRRLQRYPRSTSHCLSPRRAVRRYPAFAAKRRFVGATRDRADALHRGGGQRRFGARRSPPTDVHHRGRL